MALFQNFFFFFLQLKGNPEKLVSFAYSFFSFFYSVVAEAEVDAGTEQ